MNEKQDIIQSLKNLSPEERDRLKHVLKEFFDDSLLENTNLQSVLEKADEAKYLGMLENNDLIQINKPDYKFQGLEEAFELYRDKKISPLDFFNLFRQSDKKHWSILFKKDSRFMRGDIWLMSVMFITVQFVLGII